MQGNLLINLGAPPTTSKDDVQKFLYNLFSDPALVQLGPASPLQPSIAKLVSSARAASSAKKYQEIKGSPLVSISKQQALLLEKMTEQPTLAAMQHSPPSIASSINQLYDMGATHIRAIPMYPHFSYSTSTPALGKAIQQCQSLSIPITYPSQSMSTYPLYNTAIADCIETSLNTITSNAPDLIIFSAHGVPKSYIDKGDPYINEVNNSVLDIAKELEDRSIDIPYTLTYQSKVGPVEWTRPYLETTLKQCSQNDIRNIIIVPISFLSDCIETLHELDIEYRQLASSLGIHNFYVVPCLNTNPLLIKILKEQTIQQREP